MQLKAQVIDTITETFPTKTGPRTIHLLTCLDKSDPPLGALFNFEITAEEHAKAGTSFNGKVITIGVRNIRQNALGVLRFGGVLVG